MKYLEIRAGTSGEVRRMTDSLYLKTVTMGVEEMEGGIYRGSVLSWCEELKSVSLTHS